MATKAQAKAELLRRKVESLDLTRYCFPKQLAFVNDAARFKTACCSRRAGKTFGCAAHLCYVASKTPGVACLYFTLTRQQAKRIIWEPLKQICAKYKLQAVFNEVDLTVKFPNKSVIYLSGAKDKTEISKYLGYPLKLVYGDEAQSFRAYLRDLIDDSIAPTLLDWAGTMVLMGTPGPVPVGYFYELTQNKEWSNHHWTLLDNPHLQTKSGIDPMKLIMAECKRRNVPLEHPSIQRQFFGKWTVDSTALILTWTAANDYVTAPAGLEYVVGVDLGFSDSDSITVLGYNDTGVYLVDEIVTAKQGITPLAAQLLAVEAQYSPNAMVVDAGGLGKKIVEELVERYSLPLKAAEKSEKFSNLELLNDALRTGTFKAKAESLFVHDSRLLEWDRDKSNGDKKVVSDAFHSDCVDSTLYAYRECLHWVGIFQADKPLDPNSDAYIEQQALARYNRERNEALDPWAKGLLQ